MFRAVEPYVAAPYFLLVVHLGHFALCGGTTEYTELQPLLSGVHSVMRVKLVCAGEGGGCTPTSFYYNYPHQ
jgi:hypothetical protein